MGVRGERAASESVIYTEGEEGVYYHHNNRGDRRGVADTGSEREGVRGGCWGVCRQTAHAFDGAGTEAQRMADRIGWYIIRFGV